jgi:hypothetical protein
MLVARGRPGNPKTAAAPGSLNAGSTTTAFVASRLMSAFPLFRSFDINQPGNSINSIVKNQGT